MPDEAVRRETAEVEEEALELGGKSLARFRMLFSGDRTPTDSLTCGIAEVGPETPLPLHRHPEAEVYLGLGGTARVTVGAREHQLSEGVALFIPGGVEHAVHAEAPARFFFAFAADSYPEIDYTYLETG
jgi:quercetin dioxygenase-like cupin family protein